MIEILANNVVEVNALCDKIHNVEISFEETSNPLDKMIDTNGVKVFYNDDLYVGLLTDSYKFNNILDTFFAKRIFKNALEWCAGAGFAGFDLLSKKRINNLVLMDAYKPAIDACNKTIMNSNLKATAVHADAIGKLEDQEFDLIIGAPPWFLIKNMLMFHSDSRFRKTTDFTKEVHNEFFSNVNNYLAKDGVIIIMEGMNASSPIEFKDMIEENGLVISRIVADYKMMAYYMIIESAEDKKEKTNSEIRGDVFIPIWTASNSHIYNSANTIFNYKK